MKKFTLFILFIYLGSIAIAQNLVPNPSFENYCPSGFGQLDSVPNWYRPSNGSPDYFNVCHTTSWTMGVPKNNFGWQQARTGSGYFGGFAFTNGKTEYAQAQLLSPLCAGVTYQVEFYVSRANKYRHQVHNIGAHFSTGPATDFSSSIPHNLSYIPQVVNPVGNFISDTANWVLVSGSFVAAGGEDHITLGVFTGYTNTDTIGDPLGSPPWDQAYYYYEDVSVVAVNRANPTISPAGPFCATDLMTQLSVDVPGGTWSGTGITAPVLGNFKPIVAGIGTHTIYYTIPGGCGGIDSIQIVIDPCSCPTASFSADTVCNGFMTSFTDLSTSSSPIISWQWDFDNDGITDTTSQNPTYLFPNPGLFPVTLTIDNGSCPDDTTINVLVLLSVDASWNTGTVCFNTAPVDLNVMIIGTSGGTWSGTGVTGSIFDPAMAGVGTHSLTYAIGSGTCQNQLTQDVIVLPTADATWNAPAPICEGSTPIDLNSLITGTFGGVWSGTGVTGNTFSPDMAGTGTHLVLYSVGPNPCQDQLSLNIIVNPTINTIINVSICQGDSVLIGSIYQSSNGTYNDTLQSVLGCDSIITTTLTVQTSADASITPEGTLCSQDSSINLTAATIGGVWSGTGITDAINGTFDPTISGTGAFNIYYTISGVCAGIDSTVIDVIANPDPSWVNIGIICESFGFVDLSSLVIGDQGGNWTGTGVSNNLFNPTGLSGDINVYYSISIGLCNSSLTQIIMVTPTTTTSAIMKICVGDSILIGNLYQMNAGVYNDTLISSLGCDSIIQLNLEIEESEDPNIEFVSDLCLSSSPIQLQSDIPFGTWSGIGITDSIEGIFDPSIAGEGSHIITHTINSVLCGQNSSSTEIIISQPSIIAPNVFTPNSDGMNDLYSIKIEEYLDYSLQIYNRWGELIFATKNTQGWNGRTVAGIEASSGTYFYILEAETACGIINKSGAFSLFR